VRRFTREFEVGARKTKDNGRRRRYRYVFNVIVCPTSVNAAYIFVAIAAQKDSLLLAFADARTALQDAT
jgi:hypothetical protein